MEWSPVKGSKAAWPWQVVCLVMGGPNSEEKRNCGSAGGKIGEVTTSKAGGGSAGGRGVGQVRFRVRAGAGTRAGAGDGVRVRASRVGVGVRGKWATARHGSDLKLALT